MDGQVGWADGVLGGDDYSNHPIQQYFFGKNIFGVIKQNFGMSFCFFRTFFQMFFFFFSFF